MEPFTLTATEAAARVREGKLSPVALVESCLERIESLEPKLRAWVTVDAQGALETAHRLAKELESGHLAGPMHGVPVGIKDLFYTAGMRTTAGSPIFNEFVPTEDATMVARLKGAGAVVLGKTVTTEWAASDAPPTRNPWDLERTPGGSSTGSAVAVSARMCMGAIGTQAAGSVIRPAAYNGVVGFKPTLGRLSRSGIISHAWSIDTAGVMARTVEDAALLLEVMAGYDPLDPGSSASPVPQYSQLLNGDQKPPRIGMIRQSCLEDPSEEVREHVQSVVELFKERGAEVELVDFPGDFATVLAAHWTILRVDKAAAHEALFAEHMDEYGPHTRSLVETGLLIPAVAYSRSLRIQRKFTNDAQALVAGFDALLAPSAAAPAPRPTDLLRTGDHSLQMPWSFSGLPAICLPSGLSGDGMPFSIQFIGAPFTEERLLATAQWGERALGVELLPPLE